MPSECHARDDSAGARQKSRCSRNGCGSKNLIDDAEAADQLPGAVPGQRRLWIRRDRRHQKRAVEDVCELSPQRQAHVSDRSNDSSDL